MITQDNRSIAFFSRKLTDTQKRYSITKIKFLAIVEALYDFKVMLWGQQIVVYTDHKNLMQKALRVTSDRGYRWRLIIEEYGPKIIYIKGKMNTMADAISRLDFLPKAEPKNLEQKNWMILAKMLVCGGRHTLK